MDRIDLIHDLVLRMEDILVAAGSSRFDRVRLVSDPGGPDEVWFVWDEEKRIIVVELTDGPEALTDALAAATAGDPVLN